jgi:thiamine biosynthesis lipoprotein
VSDAAPGGEAAATFSCFGTSCAITVTGDAQGVPAQSAVEDARSALLEWHEQFSRFLGESELSRLNADPRDTVPVSPLMAQLVDTVIEAASATQGLVDATQVDEIERAGYDGELGSPLDLAAALGRAPARRPAGPRAAPRWRELSVDLARAAVTRPAGIKIDSGGLAKGLFADVLAQRLSEHRAFAVSCGGDVRIGGQGAIAREVRVESPFNGEVLHTFKLADAGVATSGIGRRSWLDDAGAPAHHLLDPATGRPAFTGIVQATALAPTAVIAEVRAKAALLSGPRRARAWLPDGGVIVLDGGRHHVIEPPPAVPLRNLQAFSKIA